MRLKCIFLLVAITGLQSLLLNNKDHASSALAFAKAADKITVNKPAPKQEPVQPTAGTASPDLHPTVPKVQEPACKGGKEIKLEQLSENDAKTLRDTLAFTPKFQCLRITANKQQLCIIKASCGGNEADDAEAVARQFDRQIFSGKLKTTDYLVSVPYIKADRVSNAFQDAGYPVLFQSVDRNNDLLVLVPQDDANTKMGDDLARKIKHDLEALDRGLAAFKNDSDKHDGAPWMDSSNPQECSKTQSDLERWVLQHTVTLSYLKVRDVLLRLPASTELCFHSWPAVQKDTFSALTIIPKRWGSCENWDKNTPLCLVPSLALEQQFLLQERNKILSTPQNGTGTNPATTQPAAKNQGQSKDKTTAGKNGAAAPAQANPPAQPATGAATGANGVGSDNKNIPQDATVNSKDEPTKDPNAEHKESADSQAAPPSTDADSNSQFVRLYHFRQAKDLAKALNNINGVTVSAVGENTDLLLLSATGAKAPDQILDMRRAIAVLDLPRPRLSLQVWSYQASSEEKDPRARANGVQDAFKFLQNRVDALNNEITEALERGVAAVENRPRDAVFESYLTKRYRECLDRDQYCLGFYDSLVGPAVSADAKASLSRLLLFLAAVSDNEAAGTVQNVIEAMRCSQCTELPPFDKFHRQLNLLSQKGNLHALRAAILDFLFIYKQSLVYPKDFVPYDLQKAAHDLDSLMQPVLDAFNQDIDPVINDGLRNLNAGKDVKGFVSSSSLQVSTISGTQASVSGKVSNYFDITPPLSLADLLKGADTGVKSSLTGVLTAKEITILTALTNLTGQPRITAEVGRGASLTITPLSLDTASSAALDVDFTVGESAGPQSTEATPRKDLLDRVAEHKVSTHVRVESLKLFSISSFTMELQHPERGKPYPIIGQAWEVVFGQTPYIGKLFHRADELKTVDNRSAAIVRAVVVPTAMDLGLSLHMEEDRVLDPVEHTSIPLRSMAALQGKARLFHRELVQCILEAVKADCSFRLSEIPTDLK